MIRLIDTGLFEAFTVQYNLLDRAYEGAIAHAGAKNVGITVMGPLAGARVIASAEVFGTILPHLAHVPELALRFVLANPNVSLAISGMESAEIIDQNARVASDLTPLAAEDYAAIDAHLKHLRAAADLCCTNCGYCMPCPQNVRIPRIFNLYNLARIYKNWDGARRGYAAIKRDVWDPEAKQADACNECGACEKKCPQNIPIRQQLKDAHQALSADQ
jgi:predicted aldo/keto reductase-like oxidoreductase